MEHHIPFLREILVFLVATSVIIPLFHRLKVSPVLGYLIVGGLIGPYGLGLWADEHELLSYIVITDLHGMQVLGEMGVVFLLFSIGLELSIQRLWTMRRMVFGMGSLQIGLCGFGIGLILWQFGVSPEASIVLGACLALSSTAIVMQLLSDGHRVATPVGRHTFSILLMQDLAVVPILFVVGIMAGDGQGSILYGIFFAIGNAVIAIAVIYFFGRVAMRPFLRFAAMSPGRELFVAAVLLAVVGTAALTGVAGLSMALGAFLAGLLLSETEFRHQVEIDMEPFKGLMMGLFFMSVGMGIDWRLVGSEPFLIIGGVVGLYALKSIIIYGVVSLFGARRHTAIESSLLLGQGGEFAFIVIALALASGVVAQDLSQHILIIVGITMLLTPMIAALAERGAKGLESRSEELEQGETSLQMADVEGRVLIAGYGRVGRLVAEILKVESIPYLAIDSDAEAVRKARKAGAPVYFGDAARIELLQRAHIEQAQAVVVTMNAPPAAERIVREIRETCPTVALFARARDKAHAQRLTDAGATIAVPETVEASLQLAGQLLRGLGAKDELVTRRLAEQRGLEGME